MTIPLAAQLVRTNRFALGVPTRFTVSPDGSTVLFLRTRTGADPTACLWAVDVESGAERLLLDGTSGPGVTGYGTDSGTRLAAAALADGLWVVDVPTGSARRLLADAGVSDPRPDPDGDRIAYLAGGALRLVAGDGSRDRALAGPDGEDVAFGVRAAGEHTDEFRGYWWAPDGDRLLVARKDSTAVRLWYPPDATDPATQPRGYRYPAVGTANDDVTLWLVAVDGTRTEVRWDRAAFEYVLNAGWDEHGPYAQVQSRDQRTVRVLGADPDTGGTTVLAEQHDDCWVQPVVGLPARTRSGALVSHLDRDGTRYLTVAGQPVTPAGLQLRGVSGVDGEDVLFTASDEPTEVHVWQYRPTGLTKLTTGRGVHSGVARGGTLVHVAGCPDLVGGRTRVERAGGGTVIESRVERPVLDVRTTSLVLGPRRLRATLHLPSWHGPDDGPLPVLLDPYGGAGAQRVTAELTWRWLVAQWFAEQGFAVLVADGSGTPGRGPGWEREVHGDLFGPVLADQVAAVREAARLRPELDLSRVGIRGWSFSGSLAALAVLRRPDVFHVAVAGAGVTDQSLYNAHWRERFLGHPAEFPERYTAASLVREAPNLTRPLLLMHGLADDNVHPANTLRLSQALLAAGRQHEVLLLPGVGHQAMGVPATDGLLRHQLRFLRRHLGVPET